MFCVIYPFICCRSNCHLKANHFIFQIINICVTAKVDKKDEIGREKNLKPSYNSMDFDEFSDFNDELEIENHPKLNAMKTNENYQFSNYREFHKLIHSYASSFLEGNSWIIFQGCDIKLLYYIDAEFSSSDDTEFSLTNYSDFPRSKEESVTAFKNVT
ncbi:unnamed protein product [Brugia pahangi]|uniref:MATH domain-containing protein n=1 Tax=Brugia pahangi TaxID=6280 RepID=A0A0N4TA74_BRUPA|nr:unnamed protein product [Brugia pahangi]